MKELTLVLVFDQKKDRDRAVKVLRADGLELRKESPRGRAR